MAAVENSFGKGRPWQRASRVWGDSDPQVTGNAIRVRLGDRYGAVLRLD